ncbi:hypothetical protein P691DRAFT_803076 [Macrolepiota fuliginosa MF-IS2]|uniref:Uncharacterized protein n=1 Tax=Macrolepiota fuliginosa MF-IS2 TaxID=1400762 RepID=A0A9P6BVX3_9AGAR|nr:hypothetical protein P691DRAFT_803076 [Macrolepiota fuliginosa MF-IS2]
MNNQTLGLGIKQLNRFAFRNDPQAQHRTAAIIEFDAAIDRHLPSHATATITWLMMAHGGSWKEGHESPCLCQYPPPVTYHIFIRYVRNLNMTFHPRYQSVNQSINPTIGRALNNDGTTSPLQFRTTITVVRRDGVAPLIRKTLHSHSQTRSTSLLAPDERPLEAYQPKTIQLP